MAWHLMKVKDLPLGKRVLSYGSQGKDVEHLQKLLNQTGFYFSNVDGTYGPLTEESVRSFQQAYKLKTDGVAGPELFKMLRNLIKNKRVGRIIYTIKGRESLDAIAQRFAVNQDAWERLPGQSNPHKKIYPGMKLLLHEKAFFIWESSTAAPDDFEVTGRLQVTWNFDGDGNIDSSTEKGIDPDSYQLIGAETETWVKLLHSHKSWRNLITEIRKLNGVRFGFDLRGAPFNTIGIWIRFLKAVCHDLKVKRIEFLLLPLPLKNQGFLENTFWLNLPRISDFTDLLLLQPHFDKENPDVFESSAAQLPNVMKQLVHQGISHKVTLVLEVGGWDWNLDSGERKQVTYRKAEILRAMNSRTAKYSDKSKFTLIHYLSRGERHALVYRDPEGWLEAFKMIKRMNLLGVVVVNFFELGKTGRDILARSFAVTPWEKFGEKKKVSVSVKS